MNWITKLVSKKQGEDKEPIKNIPDNLWTKCPSCNTILFNKDIGSNHYICNNCNYYFAMPVLERLKQIFTNGEYKLAKIHPVIQDPIKFKGKDKYIEKLQAYQKKTQQQDAAIAAYGKIGNSYASVFILNFEFIGGSMGSYVGEAFVAAAETAIKHKIPLIAITASGGARMQEGMYSLMQMAKTTVAIERLSKEKLPYIVILTNPTTGGVTASFAMLGDIHIAEEGATIGFAGVRVIEQTIRKKLPPEFQTADYLKAHGMVDIVVARKDLPTRLATLLGLLSKSK